MERLVATLHSTYSYEREWWFITTSFFQLPLQNGLAEKNVFLSCFAFDRLVQ